MQQSYSDLIAHFRRKAQQYKDMADAIEREAREIEASASTVPERPPINANVVIGASAHTESYATVVPRVHRPRTIGLPTGEPTPENIRGYLIQKRARPRDLAMHFKVEEEVIRRIVSDPLNRIGVGDRGWLFCDGQQVFFKPEGAFEPLKEMKHEQNTDNHPGV